MLKWLSKIVLLLIGIYLSICLGLFLVQDFLLFHPQKIPRNHKFKHDFAQELFLNSKDGNAEIHHLYYQQKNAKGVIVYYHGNAGLMTALQNHYNDFYQHGYDVIFQDYRSFGKSTGNLGGKALLEDAQMIYDFAAERYQPNDIIIYGRSMGSGPASYIASKNKAKALILETPYYNLASVVKTKPFLNFFPVDLILDYPFKNDEFIRNTNCPVYVFHGTADKTIPYSNAIQLEKLIADGHFFTIQNAGHNTVNQSKIYKAQIAEILK